MDVPPLVTERLDGENVRTRVDLGGEDAVFVTPTRTLVYRAEGLLSDESVSAYPHDVERIDVTSGRRKTTVELTYVDTAGKFTVPDERTDDVLVPLLEGVLTATGVTDRTETVRRAFRFSELTLVVTDARLLKHVGGAVWDDDYESFPFSAVTDLDTEAGEVATGLVITVDGRPQRVKLPSDEADAVVHAVESALLAYHDVDALPDLRDDEDVADKGSKGGTNNFDDAGIDPLVDEPDTEENHPAIDRVTDNAVEESTDDRGNREELIERIEALEAAVERQNDLLEQQRETIETLVDELRRGR
ncbi:hypothetical protein [Halosegnis sp.]|uniref:DUF7115 domain-containing protein n=1 Tax=Halosegnis sp. TaxID=2864959 RepID=UPI0035D3F976